MSAAVRPEVTVVMPAYNSEASVGEQLAALARQKVPFAWELLVCDNGSVDRTREIAEGAGPSIGILRVVDASARRGPSAARNVGGRQAGAPLLVFCDSDDVVADDWLAEMYAALQHSEAVAGRVDTDALNPPGQASVSWSPGGVVRKAFWPQFPASGAASLGVRTSLFRALDGFDESLRTGEDVDFCWRLQLAGARLAECPSAVVYVRKRVGLGPTFRQAYSWAAGDRQLRHKFAPVIAAWDSQVAQDAAARPSDGSSTGRVHARAARLLTPSGRADAASRVGTWFGSRFASVDSAGSQVRLGPRDLSPS
jgi:glycosyltransferase involved in cell wall biosynthesis